MAARRIGPRTPDVTLYLDEHEIPAVSGEPVALSLLCAGRRVLARSVKYHRPRGASCFSGRCDGCLLRVDGVPSIATCRVPARNGLTLASQNVVGSARHDLLAATDFLFPAGMNHHEMFTWSKPVNRTMQLVAREIAGVGTLPDEALAPMPVVRRSMDVLVIGAGAAGLAFAARAASGGASVLVVDEEPEPGGALGRSPDVEGEASGRGLARELADAARSAGAELLPSASVLGVFKETDGARRALVSTATGAIVATPKRVVVAQGRAETGWAFAGNDLPGIHGLDATLRALAAGVLVGEKPLLVGDGDAIERVRRALGQAGAKPRGPYPLSSLRRARGRAGVTAVDLEPGGTVKCDALVVASPEGALFELAAQAGAEAYFDGSAFELRASEVDGATRSPFVRVIGGASGVRTLPAIVAQAQAAADAVTSEVRS